jgi:hypothetical protein
MVTLTPVIFALLATQAGAAPVSNVVPVKDGETVIKAGLCDSTVVAKVEAETRPSGLVYGDRLAELQVPKSVRVVKGLRLEVDGHDLFVARSVYLDLAWVTSAEIVHRGKRWLLIISGGGGAESYFAEIEFDWTAIRKRSVFSAEFSSEPTQETVYRRLVVE